MKNMYRFGLLAVFVLCSVGLWGQTSTLVVFNELKEDFTLTINGEVVNAVPAQHIRVTGLKPSHYRVHAQFVNRSLPAQQLEIQINANREISYALNRPAGNKGVPVFEFLSEFSMGYFPIAPQASVSFAYNGPLEVPGQTIAPVVPNPQQPVIIEPVRPNPLPGYSGPFGCTYPMDAGAFAEAKKSIAAKSFSETKIQLAKQVTRSNCLLTSQVQELMGLLTFEVEKLDFAKFAYDFTYDKGNYYKVSDSFGFESSTRDLQKYLQEK